MYTEIIKVTKMNSRYFSGNDFRNMYDRAILLHLHAYVEKCIVSGDLPSALSIYQHAIKYFQIQHLNNSCQCKQIYAYSIIKLRY